MNSGAKETIELKLSLHRTMSGMFDREKWESMNFGKTSAHRLKKGFLVDAGPFFSALRAHGHTITCTHTPQIEH